MLSKFPNSMLKIGAKVSLSPQSQMRDERYGSGPVACNPLGVPGRVVRLSENSGVYVEWSSYNGGNVYYRWDHYDLIAEGEPGYLEVD